MMRSMFSGVSGLRSFQTMMDVVGDNIANVYTAGFKSSQVTFKESLVQTLAGSSGGGSTRGGTNPLQIGLGVKVGSIDGVFTQGATQVTGRPTDLAIQGEGFFALELEGQRVYTRAGAFRFDETGNFVASGGYLVQGWSADAGGILQVQTAVGPLRLPLSQVIEPVLTTEVELGGNLSADIAVGDPKSTSIIIFDSMGNARELLLQFTKNFANDWTMSGSIDGNAVTLSTTSITFDTAGNLSSTGTITVSGYTPPGSDPINLDLILDNPGGLVQFGGPVTSEATSQNGNAIGFLSDFAISENGTITGQFSNGETKVLAQVAITTFSNPSGLQRLGESNFSATVNSGQPLTGEPGAGNRGLLSAGALEMSNVELALEFTNLIIAQRGFQANSRIITASDEILQDLVNIKR